MKKIKLGLLIGLLCGACSAWSAEKMPFNDNETLSVRLSQNNINKIFIEGDPIIDLHAPQDYIVTSDDDDGALYVQMAMTSPFTMYVSTEQRHHVGLTVTPVQSMGKTIELIPKTGSVKAREWENKKGYESSVISLMKALMQNKKPDGFGLQTPRTTEFLHVYEKGRLSERLIYQGNHLKGIVYELCNESSQTMMLKEEDFMRDGVKAVALSRYVIEPHTMAIVYEVVGV